LSKVYTKDGGRACAQIHRLSRDLWRWSRGQ